jgi:hypothetical protein
MDYDPKDAVKHVVHDYVYLVTAGTDLQRSQTPPFNHYAERTFLVHCRALGDFFSDGNDRRDLHARDFTRTPFVRELPAWDHWRGHIDKHLMHLTKARITNTIPWTGEPNKSFLEEFRAVWREFLSELKEELKPLFKEEINRHQAYFVGYQL